MSGSAEATTTTRHLLAQLHRLDWRDEHDTLLATSRLLQARETARLIVDEQFAAWKRGEHSHGIELFSRETTTHWKWFVAGDVPGPLIWIHEYKPSASRRGGYAQSIHDHRYSFCSAIVHGGYTHRRFAIGGDQALNTCSAESLSAPHVYCLDADEVHSVDDILDGTLTLIVQAPKRRGYSTEYFADGRAACRHYDFSSRARQRNLL